MKIQLTRDLAYSAGLDEANRSMKAAGRQAWNEEDYQVAWATFNRLWPQCVHKIDRGECGLCDAAGAIRIRCKLTLSRLDKIRD